MTDQTIPDRPPIEEIPAFHIEAKARYVPALCDYIDRLETALLKYGNHKSCKLHNPHSVNGPEPACTCGWDQIRAAIEAARKGER